MLSSYGDKCQTQICLGNDEQIHNVRIQTAAVNIHQTVTSRREKIEVTMISRHAAEKDNRHLRSPLYQSIIQDKSSLSETLRSKGPLHCLYSRTSCFSCQPLCTEDDWAPHYSFKKHACRHFITEHLRIGPERQTGLDAYWINATCCTAKTTPHCPSGL